MNCETHINDVKSLRDGSIGVERESGVDLGGNLARNNLQDLLAELDKKAVESCVNLIIVILAVLAAVGNSGIDKLGVLGLLGGSENERRIGSGVLRLVFGNGSKITRVADDDLREIS